MIQAQGPRVPQRSTLRAYTALCGRAQHRVGERAILVQLPRGGFGMGKERRGGVEATREMHIHVNDSHEGLPELLVEKAAFSRNEGVFEGD